MACSATGDEEATENPQWAVKTFDMSKFTSRDEQTMWKNLKKKKIISEKLYFKAWLTIALLRDYDDRCMHISFAFFNHAQKMSVEITGKKA